MTEEEAAGVYVQPLAEGREAVGPMQDKPLPLCEHAHEGHPCGLRVCMLDPPSANPTLTSKAMYWEVCNKRGRRVGYIKWVTRSSVKRWTSHKKGKSICKAVSVGVSAVSVGVGGAGIVAAGTGQEEIAGPLFIASGMGDLIGVGIDFAHDFTGC